MTDRNAKLLFATLRVSALQGVAGVEPRIQPAYRVPAEPTPAAGQEAYDAINSASFTKCDVFVLVFALAPGRWKTTLENIEGKWYKDIKQHLVRNGSFTPQVILCGTQADLMDPATKAEINERATTIANKLGAKWDASHMTSAYKPQDFPVKSVIDAAARAGIYKN